jgi:L-ascorbate metabolism protein UlaG (beta-lactamase superfamily)
MQRPVLQDASFLSDVAATRGKPRGCRLWWLGQSGFLLQWRGHHLLIDPYLSDSLTEKYAGTDRPHVRLTERVVDPGELDFIEVVTSSHNHTDHLDAATLNPLRAANPGLRMIIPEANRGFVAQRLGCDPVWPAGLDDGTRTQAGVWTVHGVASAHETVERDERGRCRYLGYVIEFGPYRVYHSGDCRPYDGLVERLRPFGLDVALLPINGALPERGVAGNFWGREAAALAKAVGARCAVPCHYGMFEFNTVTAGEFEAACGGLDQPYVVLEQGEALAVRKEEAD